MLLARRRSFVVLARDLDTLLLKRFGTCSGACNAKNSDMHTIRTLTACTGATAVVLLTAACGGQEGTTGTVQEPLTFAPTTTPAVTMPTGVAENSRGALEKQWRELAGAGCEDPTNCDALFALDPPTDATGCRDSIPSENGQLKAFSFTVQTGSNFAPANYGTLLGGFDFAAIRANGYTQTNLWTDASINCDESDQVLPTQLAPRSMYTGFVVLDLPPDSTAIAYRPAFATGGWEWKLNGGVA